MTAGCGEAVHGRCRDAALGRKVIGIMGAGKTSALKNRLVLYVFMCRQFGYLAVEDMLEELRGVPSIFPAVGASEFARSLYVNPARAQVSHDQLAEYDANVAAHSLRLHMTGEHGRAWKPHQYIALLFTEHYLRRYFDDPEALRRDLNLALRQEHKMLAMPEYTLDDLRGLAFQSATGSGKTLLMHANILQYRHYLDKAGGRLNNVVLLTPNEQMSTQHERELHASGLHARLFSSEAGADLFQPVEIIDLNKLAEKKGVKRVAVADFGDDNLVLVDEGHLGASGKVWRERRGSCRAVDLRSSTPPHSIRWWAARIPIFSTPTASACSSTTHTGGFTTTATARTTRSPTCRTVRRTRTATCTCSAAC